MKHKKHLLGVVMIGTMLAVTVLSGCESGKTEKTENVSQDNLVTLKERASRRKILNQNTKIWTFRKHR